MKNARKLKKVLAFFLLYDILKQALRTNVRVWQTRLIGDN